MKAIFITYNQAFHDEIMDIMNKSGIRGYTYWEQVAGKGSVSGDPHLGDHAWPTLNSSLMIMLDESLADPFMRKLSELDKSSPAMGLRAFKWAIEASI